MQTMIKTLKKYTNKKNKHNKNKKGGENSNKSTSKKRKKEESPIFQKYKTQRKPVMPTVQLGKAGNGYKSKIDLTVSDQEIDEFIKTEIKEGPQIVSIPTGKERHAFLVDIESGEDGMIFISDWGGPDNETRGLQEIEVYVKPKNDSCIKSIANLRKEKVINKEYDRRFEVYSKFMIKLKEKYNLLIAYLSVDQDIYEIADEWHNKNRGGASAKYIYLWAEEYYKNYRV
jgi:hypothetical protein